MSRRLAAIAALCAVLVPPVAAPAAKGLATTAAEVVARNEKARGGVEAWRRVETMVWLGHLERADQNHAGRVPFVMTMKRPNWTRFELKEQMQQYTRVFNGSKGWKVRPGPDGRPDTKPMSPAEVQYAQSEFPIDGPLLDADRKGVKIELDGVDLVEGRKAYRLSLALPGGGERKIWIDTNTNLELRYDRPASNPLIAGKPVSTYYRQYAKVDGLSLPMSIEVLGAAGHSVTEAADKLVLDKVFVNPKLDDDTFVPPPMLIRRSSTVRIPGEGPGGVVPPL